MSRQKASENARAVAYKVVEKVRKGELVNVGSLMREQGYSPSISKQTFRVTKQKVYQDIVIPALQQIDDERNRIMKAMSEKNLTKEKYSTLVSGYDILTKNKQLLSGKATENVAVVIEVSEAIAKKNSAKTDETSK